MRVIIAGGRDFMELKMAHRELSRIHAYDFRIHTVLSGGARGADAIGERWAEALFIPVLKFPADWKSGKGAGFARNIEMAEEADALIAFWDFVSRGTEHMIDTALWRGLRVVIIGYNIDPLI